MTSPPLLSASNLIYSPIPASKGKQTVPRNEAPRICANQNAKRKNHHQSPFIGIKLDNFKNTYKDYSMENDNEDDCRITAT